MTIPRPDSLAPYRDFQSLLDNLLEDLQRRFGMALWMITRQRDDHLVLLRRRDRHYGLRAGDTLRWPETYCIHMLERQAPHIVPDVRDDPGYQAAAVNQQLTIGSYIGFPLYSRLHGFFGTLCALDPAPQPAGLTDHQPALEHQARLIAFLLDNAMERLKQERITHFLDNPNRCEITGLLDHQGWRDVLDREAAHCRDFGLETTAVYLNGPDHSAPTLIADSLAALLREQDSIAHLGDNRFAILLAETHRQQAHRIADRVRDALNAKQVLVEVAMETVSPRSDAVSE